MDERRGLYEAIAAGERRRDDGIRLLAFGILTFLFGVLVPMSHYAAVLCGLAVLVIGSFLISSGKRRAAQARDQLAALFHEP